MTLLYSMLMAAGGFAIPIIDLYVDGGEGTRYRSLGCGPCTQPVAERSGRAQDGADDGGGFWFVELEGLAPIPVAQPRHDDGGREEEENLGNDDRGNQAEPHEGRLDVEEEQEGDGEESDGFIDGGVFAPNPSMCALAQTQDARTGESVPLAEVRLLSIGTGQELLRVEGDHDWGYAQWAKPLVELMLDGVNGIADFQCERLLRDHYHRLAPVFPPNKSFKMDDVGKIREMVTFAMGVDIAPAAAWIRGNFL